MGDTAQFDVIRVHRITDNRVEIRAGRQSEPGTIKSVWRLCVGDI